MNLEKTQYMKDVFYIMALCLVVVGGCATPLGKFNKKEAVVESLERKQTENENKQVESGRTFVYAADQALQKDPEPSRHSSVAKSMTTRSITALGPPQAANALKSDTMITDLLSDDPKIVEKGQAELAVMDKELIAIQNRNRVYIYRELLCKSSLRSHWKRKESHYVSYA